MPKFYYEPVPDEKIVHEHKLSFGRKIIAVVEFVIMAFIVYLCLGVIKDHILHTIHLFGGH